VGELLIGIEPREVFDLIWDIANSAAQNGSIMGFLRVKRTFFS
jgi:hypothetical protein